MIRLALLLCLCSGACAQPAPAPTSQALAPHAPAPRSAALVAILDEHVEWLMRESPVWASQLGDDRYNHLLPDASYEACVRRTDELRDRLARLVALDPSSFTEEDHVDAGLLRLALENAIAGAAFYPEQIPLDARWGPQIELAQLPDQIPLLTSKHYADYASRLEQVPRLIDQHIQQMRFGLNAGRLPPGVTMSGCVEQCLSLADPRFAADPTAHPMYAPFLDIDPSDLAAVRARAAISDGIAPAFARLAAFLRDDYIPACRTTIGASQGKDGLPAYELALRVHTTTSLTAQQIHDIGLSEVARIRGEMLKTIARTDFPPSDLTGDALLAAFLNHLRTDPRFYHTSAQALLSDYRDIAKVIDAELPRLFKTLPRLPYGVREMPAIMAPVSPTAYYNRGSLASGVPGIFIANTYALDQRPKYEMIALTLHEAVPGHHLQIALAQELEGVHPYRRLTDHTAFVEGWALYAESLGLDMGESPRSAGGRGLFEDPYDDFGRLTYEMWRACRLVVDTGIHAMGWSRQQAIDYMLANTALSPLNIEREVDRYIGWPGQACAYKIGELKIQELRRQCESALGNRFDLREFHEVVLGAGAVPLPVLEERIQRWLETRAIES